MNNTLTALKAEIIKTKHSPIHWISFAAFALAPIFGGVIMFLMKTNGLDGLSGALKSKATVLSISAAWPSFINILIQAVGVGGIVICGFVTSWLFGREYAEGTLKDLLALPVSRISILNAKFIYAAGWCLALAISNLLLGLVIGMILGLPGWDTSRMMDQLGHYLITAIMIMLLNTPVAYFALRGKGYLSPLALVVFMLVLAQILGALGIGQYFPWAVPGLYSGSGGEAYQSQLNFISYALLCLTGISGYFLSLRYWTRTDHTK